LEVFGFSFACCVAGFLKISNRFFQIPIGRHCKEIERLRQREGEIGSIDGGSRAQTLFGGS
jgi:hypothetical protein